MELDTVLFLHSFTGFLKVVDEETNVAKTSWV
jgi:hypothetical protein